MAEGEVQGPIQPGTDAKLFRRTGRTRRFRRGPVRPGTDEDFFRRTGKRRTIAERDAQEKADREAKALAEKLEREKIQKEIDERNKEIKRKEFARQISKRIALREQRRIEDFRRRLILQGAQIEERDLRNKDGDRIRTRTTFTNGRKNRIFEVSNLDKGTTTTRTFGKTKRGGSNQTGGLKVQRSKQGPKQTFFELVSEVQPRRISKPPIISGSLRLNNVSRFIDDKLKILGTKQLRKQKLTNAEGLQVVGLSIVSAISSFTSGIVDTPEFLFNVVSNPSILKKLPSYISSSGKEFGELLRVSPTEAITKVGTNLFLIKASGSILNEIGKRGKSALVTASGKSLGKAKTGSVIKIPSKGGKTAKLKVVAKIPKQTLRSQVKLSGKKVSAISSQADKLLGTFKKSKTIKKPIPTEAKLSTTAKRLLAKFDKGKITKKELGKLNKLIRKSGSKGILERSFFADPSGKIRPSRLGLTGNERLKLLDYLTEDISFRSQKPQILFFDNIKVQKFPSSLKKVVAKLKKGQSLTNAEELQLLKFQLKKSGKFKPLGFVTKESELTLAPGELLRKVKTVGFIKVRGQSIPVVSVEVYTPSKTIQNVLKSYQKGKLSSLQIKKLDSILKKQTGIDYKLLSSYKKGRINLNVGSIAYRVLSGRKRLSRKLSSKRLSRKLSKSTTSKTSKKKKFSKLSKSKTSKTSKGKTSKTSKGGSSKAKTSLSRSKGGSSRVKGGSSKSKSTTTKKPPILGKKKKIKRKVVILKFSKGYNVFARPLKKNKKSKVPELVRVNKVPLTLQRARDLRNYILDTSLARTGKIKPTKGKPRKQKIKVPIGYAKRTVKKFRRVKIKRGNKMRLSKNKVIEKRKNLLDTKQEKKKIGLRKRIKQLVPKKKVVKKKKVAKKKTSKKKPMSKTAMARKMAKLRSMKKKK
jgi:hypothetical protein